MIGAASVGAPLAQKKSHVSVAAIRDYLRGVAQLATEAATSPDARVVGLALTVLTSQHETIARLLGGLPR